ncbi:hypothetical protein CBS147332_7321 [Penicillium roqueforti]|nr:hypothetical protein CBS147332_7321 [Penicillium roqueforti]KAI3105365.1 hypothetical protein CBS147331_7056 [Penicillium roqueforti]
MGRWGWRLFESDQDLDVVIDLTDSLGINIDHWEHNLAAMVHQTDILAPARSIALYSTPGYTDLLANVIVLYFRQQLDSDNLGERLFAASRAKEADTGDLSQDAKYRTIILGKVQFLAALDHYLPVLHAASRSLAASHVEKSRRISVTSFSNARYAKLRRTAARTVSVASGTSTK